MNTITEKKAMQLALEALTESVDLVANELTGYKEIYSGYPSRAGRIAAMQEGLDAHRKAIEQLAAILATAATQPPQDERGQAYAKCWVCGRPMDGKSEDDCHCFHRRELAASAPAQQAGHGDEQKLAIETLRRIRATLASGMEKAAMGAAILALSEAAKYPESLLMEADGVDALLDDGWIWDGDQWQRALASTPPQPVAAESPTQKGIRATLAVQGLSKAFDGLGAGRKDRKMKVTDEMVSRFLMWRLPAEFSPDCGISFKSESDYEHPVFGRSKHEPMGTNLFNADQARAMLEHILMTGTGSDESKKGEA